MRLGHECQGSEEVSRFLQLEFFIVSRDLIISFGRYFSEAAAQEEPEALYQLGMMFDSPAYGTPNSANARLHYQRAAQVCPSADECFFRSDDGQC